MTEVLFWLYLTNAVLLINHEIDSAYWKEWELFGLPGDIGGFLLLHFPLLFIILYGMAAAAGQRPSALWFSLLLSAGGILAYGIHTYFLKQGRHEFDHPVSKLILWATLIVSLVQLAVTIILLTGGTVS